MHMTHNNFNLNIECFFSYLFIQFNYHIFKLAQTKYTHINIMFSLKEFIIFESLSVQYKIQCFVDKLNQLEGLVDDPHV